MKKKKKKSYLIKSKVISVSSDFKHKLWNLLSASCTNTMPSRKIFQNDN